MADLRQDRPGRALTVMTYNVGNGMARPGRLVAVLRRLRVDLVGLQEVAWAQAAAIAADLADVYLYQHLMPAGFAGKGLLSRYPLSDARPLDLHPDRSDLAVSVDAEGVSLSVFVVHLPPPRVRWSGLVFNQATDIQVDALIQLAARTAPSLLLGDFNMTAADPFHARLTAMGLVDAFRTAGAGRGATLPVRLGQSARLRHRLERVPLRPFMRVDYIWYTAPLRAHRAWVGPDAGSDHLPVLARLTLPA